MKARDGSLLLAFGRAGIKKLQTLLTQCKANRAQPVPRIVLHLPGLRHQGTRPRHQRGQKLSILRTNAPTTKA